MLSCRQVSELCSQEMERTLGVTERLSLAAHLMVCSGCTQFRRQMRTLRQAMRAYAEGKASLAEWTDRRDA